MSRRPEVLSPAGSPEKLKTAIAYGCDAVYMAGKRFGLRTFSDNFDHDDMKSCIAYAHERGVKCYVTMNIMGLEADMKVIDDEIDFVAHEAHADAVLVSDPGIFVHVKRVAPDLEIHISTQASTTNSDACKFWYEQGARRIVLARELSLSDIKQIRNNIPSDLELEAFVHGAMCISYSGRCILSNYFTGRRSNGGACAQPCRWGYSLVEEKRPDEALPIEQDERGTYILSSKDLSMIEHIPDLVDAGVDSLKIEGRIKGDYYAAVTAKVYREAVDLYLKDPEGWKVDPAWPDLLEKLTHRDYDTGFFYDSPSDDAKVALDRTYVKPAFVVAQITGKNPDGSFRAVQKNKLYAGDTLNVLKPVGYEAPLKVISIMDKDGSRLDSVPHPGTEFDVVFDRETDLPELTFLSRDGDKDGGISPMA
ncbi:MAG: U32 family peptidase [Clostridiales bacterium]|nr:U32 family peptidase [Clostridiales bacterium]MBP3809837.1 U32 family peptidase [Clostridiales bacterium]